MEPVRKHMDVWWQHKMQLRSLHRGHRSIPCAVRLDLHRPNYFRAGVDLRSTGLDREEETRKSGRIQQGVQ